MKKIVLLLLFGFFAFESFAQQLPWGWCGIVNVYDAAGNRTKRVYFCQNGDPYPQRSGGTISEPDKTNATEKFEAVDQLFPNPTNGKVFIRFSREINNASLSIIDNLGKTLTQFKAKGFTVEFDLSGYPSGIYYIRIEEAGKVITKKVIKQ